MHRDIGMWDLTGKTRGKIMLSSDMDMFMKRTGRYYKGNPMYLLGIRAALICLGYDKTWVEGRFRKTYEKRFGGNNEKKNKQLHAGTHTHNTHSSTVARRDSV